MSKDKFFNSNFYVGKENWVNSTSEDLDIKEREFKSQKEKIQMYLKKYLLLDNVNFLFGAGSSIHLGAETIRGIPKQVKEAVSRDDSDEIFDILIENFKRKLEENLKQELNGKDKYLIWENIRDELSVELKEKLSNDELEIEDEKINLIQCLGLLEGDEKDKLINACIKVPLEDFLNYLMATKYLLERSDGLFDNDNITYDKVDKLINTIKKAMFKMCDIDKITLEENKYLQRDTDTKDKMEKEGKYTYHKSFLTSILQRPLNLRRANIFTLNYDLAFEYSFDELGVQYIDGFVGFHQRNFRPEVFNYDYFYPGDTTEGKVRRIERVVKYYKLHGSLTWVHGKKGVNNPYELYEKPIELIRNQIKEESDEISIGDVMIYPTSTKKEFTLNFPYSDLFRKFADRLQQPEAVLFSIGYSFYDEHINDIIYQALANPSFTLITVNFSGIKNSPELKRLKELEDPKIIICEGPYLGDFKMFSKEILPNIDEYDTRSEVAKSLKKLFEEKSNNGDDTNV